MKTNPGTSTVNPTHIIIKLWFIGLLISILTACANDNPPYPQKLADTIRTLEVDTPLAVMAEDNYPASDNGQIITASMRFRTIYDLYNHNVLAIPAGTDVSAAYYNNGVRCVVYWNSIYANGDQVHERANAVSLKKKAIPTLCDPTKGIKKGERLDMNFQHNSNS